MRITAVLLAALAMTACIHTASNPATGNVNVDVRSPFQKGQDWKATINGQAGYAITGEAVALAANNQTEIRVSISGATPGAVLPWHLHDGDCNIGGGIVGDPSAYQPLVVGDNGQAQGQATISGNLNEAKKYHVNIHQSPANMATIIACGDLKH